MADLTPEQYTAITYELATARDDIQDDLKAKFGHGENIFFYNDLIEYRLNNPHLDIAEDLDLEERYDLINDQAKLSVSRAEYRLKLSVSRAFIGYDEEHFPEHKFGGLFGKVTNDYIAGIRKVHSLRKNLIRFWQRNPEMLEHQIYELKYEQGLTWNDITSKLNEKYDVLNWTTEKYKDAYHNNKHRYLLAKFYSKE